MSRIVTSLHHSIFHATCQYLLAQDVEYVGGQLVYQPHTEARQAVMCTKKIGFENHNHSKNGEYEFFMLTISFCKNQFTFSSRGIGRYHFPQNNVSDA